MDRLRKKLFVAYAGLALAASVLLALTEIAPDGDFLDAYGPNFVAELAGILVTVLLVDRLLRWEHERRLQPLREVALRRVRRPIVSLLSLVANMYAAAAPPEGPTPSTWNDLLSRCAVDSDLDYSRVDLDSRAPTAHEQSWGVYAASLTAHFEQSFLADVDRYAEVLSTRLVRAGHHVLEDVVFRYLMQFPGLQALGQQQGSPFGSALPGLVASSVPEFVERAVELVAAYDELAPSHEGLADARSG